MRTIVIAGNHRIAIDFALRIGLSAAGCTIAYRVNQFRGNLSPQTLVFVETDTAEWNPEYPAIMAQLRSRDCAVVRLSLDKLMGVTRP